jgi:hypothetical protein
MKNIFLFKKGTAVLKKKKVTLPASTADPKKVE